MKRFIDELPKPNVVLIVAYIDPSDEIQSKYYNEPTVWGHVAFCVLTPTAFGHKLVFWSQKDQDRDVSHYMSHLIKEYGVWEYAESKIEEMAKLIDAPLAIQVDSGINAENPWYSTRGTREG